MQKQIIIIVLFLILILGGLFAIKSFIPKKQVEDFNYHHMELKSDVFKNGEYIPAKYTCDGIDVNPSLQFSNVPKDAKSLVLIVDDPDALSEDFVHWVVWNINPQAGYIEEGSLWDKIVEGRNDFGKNVYGGPCPPALQTEVLQEGPSSGAHQYIFKLYAIDFVFDKMSLNTDKTKILKLIEKHILAKVELVGLYER